MSLPVKTKKQALAKTGPEAMAALAQSGLFTDSPENLRNRSYGMALVNPSSKILPMVLNYLKCGAYYNEMTDDVGNRVYGSVFFIDRPEIADLLAAYRLVSGWKTVFYFKNLRLLQNQYNVFGNWISCYVDSMAAPDLTAYCCIVERDTRFKYLCPCKGMEYQLRIDYDHPSQPENQYQAEAVRLRYSECPNFSMSNFRRISK